MDRSAADRGRRRTCGRAFGARLVVPALLLFVFGIVLAAVVVPVRAGAAPPTPSPLRVAGVVDAELYGGAELGARARFMAVNADGGVDGRMIELVQMSDDTRSPDADVVAVRHAIAQHVDAIVPMVSGAFAAVPDLERAQVPAFGWGISGAYCASRWVFAITGCLTPLLPHVVPGIWGASTARAISQRHPAAAVVADGGGADRAVGEISTVARAAGMRVTYAAAALSGDAATPSDIDGIAAKILVSNRTHAPDVVFTVSNFTNVAALQSALRAHGYTGVLTNLVQYAPLLAGEASGSQILTQFATPESAATNLAMRTIVAEIRAVTADPITPAMLAGWFAADMFVDAARRAGPDASAAGIQRVAQTMTYEVPDTIGPTRFPRAFTVATSCGQLVTSDGTAYSVSVPFTCSPPVPFRVRR